MSGEEGIAGVLAEHEISYERRAWPSYECSCGEWDGSFGEQTGGADTDTADDARAHVAAAVVAWLRENAQDAGCYCRACKTIRGAEDQP